MENNDPAPLSEEETATLASLLGRAVANNQLGLCVKSPLLPGEPDLFHDGDRHDGHQCFSDEWRTETGTGFPDEDSETERAEIRIYLDEKSIAYLAGLPTN